jgi:hypothetical protein
MKSKSKKPGALPDSFESYEAAAEFWDTHDTTDYLQFTTPVRAEIQIRKRHFEVEVDDELLDGLQRRARKLRKPVNAVVGELLRKSLAAVG